MSMTLSTSILAAAIRPTRIVSGAIVAVLACSFATAQAAPCVMEINGKWQQTHTLIQGNKIPDDTQSWLFKPDGSMLFVKTKPALSIPGKYSCDGYTIHLSGRMSNSFKIADHGLETMTWESNLGGTVYVKRVPK